MHIVTANLNGIRSAISKGFYTWLSQAMPDVVCIQETKAQLKLDNIPLPCKYHNYFSDAEKKGYSGVAIFSQEPAISVNLFGDDLFDNEGRYLAVELEKIIIISIYLPSGTSGPERQKIKMQCLETLYKNKLKQLLNDKKHVVIAGDFNIAHKKIDLKNWQANQKKTGFLPEERAWIDQVLALGWRDSFRMLNQEAEQYTWWSYRSAARKRNVGWRLDYQIISPGLRPIKAKIEHEPIISDHAPLSVFYELD